MKRILALLLLSFGLCFPAGIASDWDEDSPKVQPGVKAPLPPTQDTVILDDDSRSEGGHTVPSGTAVLQGNATAIRRKPIAPTSSMLEAEQAQRLALVERIDAGAIRFLQMAHVNVLTPPSVFRSFIEKNHPEFSLESALNSPSSLLVIRGQWDDSTKPLRSLGLKFEQIKSKELPEAVLDKYKVLIVDCAGEIPRAGIQKIRDFVGRGGYLLTTDWALKNTLEPAFPGFVQWNRDNTDGEITDAFIVNTESPLLVGLSGRRFTWKLDKMSQCVRILNPARVHMIARSTRLSVQDPQLRVLPDPLLAGGLALEFTFGRGKVLHLVGHFDNCSTSFRPLLLPDPAPGAGISLRQSLAANFIIEALEAESHSTAEPAGKDASTRSLPAADSAPE